MQIPGSNIVSIGINLKEFYPSVEWDILEIPAGRNEEYYPEYSEPFSGRLKQIINAISFAKITCLLTHSFQI